MHEGAVVQTRRVRREAEEGAKGRGGGCEGRQRRVRREAEKGVKGGRGAEEGV